MTKMSRFFCLIFKKIHLHMPCINLARTYGCSPPKPPWPRPDWPSAPELFFLRGQRSDPEQFHLTHRNSQSENTWAQVTLIQTQHQSEVTWNKKEIKYLKIRMNWIFIQGHIEMYFTELLSVGLKFKIWIHLENKRRNAFFSASKIWTLILFILNKIIL